MPERSASPGDQHPIIRLVLENPISALNTAAILFGGGMVWATMTSRLSEMDREIAAVRAQVQRVEQMSATIDTATVNKFDAINRDLTEMKVEMRGLRTSLDFLVARKRRSGAIEGRPPFA